jgi:hypothetical protein
MIASSHGATIVRQSLEVLFFLVFGACTVFKIWQGIDKEQRVAYQSGSSKVRKSRLLVNTIYVVSWLGMMVTFLLGKIGNY